MTLNSLKHLFLFVGLICSIQNAFAQETEKQIAAEEHAMLKIPNSKDLNLIQASEGGQWFPKAGLGLFIHWGLSSVEGAYGLSWAMIPGRALKKKQLTQEEIMQILKTKDFNMDGFADTLDGHKPRLGCITPNSYYKNAEKFKAENFDPDKIIREAAKAGFKYAVLTTKHHDGFALWPSDYGTFSTKNHMENRDLVGEYVKACKKYGLKVGFYFSGMDFHFANAHGRQNFMYWGTVRSNPQFPAIDANWNAFDMPPNDAEWIQKYDTFKVNQIKELLTRYGKIDLLWFDGQVPAWAFDEIIKLQPEIIFNHRWEGPAHYDSGFENHLPTENPTNWWEMCRTWQEIGWGYLNNTDYKSNAFVLSELIQARLWGGNYLLNISPKGDGSLPKLAYDKIEELADWQTINNEVLSEIAPLPKRESSNVLAAQKNNIRYLFIAPTFNADSKKDKGRNMLDANLLPPVDVVLELKGISKPKQVKLLGSDKQLKYSYDSEVLKITVPASMQTKLIDVVKVEL